MLSKSCQKHIEHHPFDSEFKIHPGLTGRAGRISNIYFMIVLFASFTATWHAYALLLEIAIKLKKIPQTSLIFLSFFEPSNPLIITTFDSSTLDFGHPKVLQSSFWRFPSRSNLATVPWGYCFIMRAAERAMAWLFRHHITGLWQDRGQEVAVLAPNSSLCLLDWEGDLSKMMTRWLKLTAGNAQSACLEGVAVPYNG